jgi:hypothetical protein
MADVSIRDEGSVVLFTPESDAGREWVEEHIGADNGFQPYWPTVVVEHRYAGDVADGMVGDGLELE